ncbi:hypothetical protein [Streptomyces lycii]|uniref:Uncharacterized protein n=1 Tax=Streptomyces lycii TaxID=2654337 RepID=A0ABQ7FJT4_9ACTN|nr:hypothetical protein [Streptomyces lycii]KAF4408635.1 hypothetical protein GCU69_13125 [Streptomyces lycii]
MIIILATDAKRVEIQIKGADAETLARAEATASRLWSLAAAPATPDRRKAGFE